MPARCSSPTSTTNTTGMSSTATSSTASTSTSSTAVHRGVALAVHRGVALAVHRGVALAVHRGVALAVHRGVASVRPACDRPNLDAVEAKFVCHKWEYLGIAEPMSVPRGSLRARRVERMSVPRGSLRARRVERMPRGLTGGRRVVLSAVPGASRKSTRVRCRRGSRERAAARIVQPAHRMRHEAVAQRVPCMLRALRRADHSYHRARGEH